jgi:acetate kinase
MTQILVFNSGSSSVKFQVVDTATGESLAGGLIERVTNHAQAFAEVVEQVSASGLEPRACGHRVVHGGARFSEPVLIDEAALAEIEQLSHLAPLHNPANLAGIRAAIEAFAGLPQVAVFDTAFHQSMPESAYSYAIDAEITAAHQIRKYGFHGTSHAFVAKATAQHLKLGPDELNAIVLHLGNGASATAVRGGRSIDTSMGFTPLAGLVMGTRSGDIDPALVLHLHRHADLSLDEVDELLNSQSGLLGLAGSADMRDVVAKASAGDASAELALEVYAHRVRHYIGAYHALVGPLHALVFTAGVGENSAAVRSRILRGLEHLGLTLDAERNESAELGIRVISKTGAAVQVLVVPTNEELEIAQQTAKLLGSHPASGLESADG